MFRQLIGFLVTHISGMARDPLDQDTIVPGKIVELFDAVQDSRRVQVVALNSEDCRLAVGVKNNLSLPDAVGGKRGSAMADRQHFILKDGGLHASVLGVLIEHSSITQNGVSKTSPSVRVVREALDLIEIPTVINFLTVLNKGFEPVMETEGQRDSVREDIQSPQSSRSRRHKSE